MLMRLSEGWRAALRRERGRSGASSGGLGGGSGAGETELQLQRRRLRSRIKALKRQLDDVSLRLIASGSSLGLLAESAVCWRSMVCLASPAGNAL